MINREKELLSSRYMEPSELRPDRSEVKSNLRNKNSRSRSPESREYSWEKKKLLRNQTRLADLLSMTALGIAGKFAGIWLPHTMFALPLAIYLLHNFIAGLPRDLMEAAYVDGANHFTVFRRIVRPLAVPGIASIAIFQFLWVWNDLLVALTFASGTEEVAPINSKLASLVGQYGSGYTQLSAGAFITIAIPLIVFFSLQRYFVRGLLAGSVK